MPILQDVLGVGRLWTVGFYVPDVLLEAGLQIPAGLTHMWEVAGFTGQTVDPTFVVGWDVEAGGWFCELCYCVAAFVTAFVTTTLFVVFWLHYLYILLNRTGLSALRPTPNLEDQGISPSLVSQLEPVWLRWPYQKLNLLKPNDIYIYIYIYICRTAALTSRRYILNIYSTNIHIEYFKHAA